VLIRVELINDSNLYGRKLCPGDYCVYLDEWCALGFLI